MKSAEAFLSSLKQRRLSYLSNSALVGESASETVEIPSELLIAATLGLCVFPVIGYSMHAATKAGIETATSDLALIEYWIRQHYGDPLNWYVATGPGPLAGEGVVALEVVGDVGRASLCELCQDDWDWIDTLRSQAGNDARYLFFQWPDNMAMSPSAKQLAPGLILHGEGDSVPIPPSQTSSGISRAYLTPRAALAYPPEWLIEAAFQAVEAIAGSRSDSIGNWSNSSAA
jgi:hypothetical protein